MSGVLNLQIQQMYEEVVRLENDASKRLATSGNSNPDHPQCDGVTPDEVACVANGNDSSDGRQGNSLIGSYRDCIAIGTKLVFSSLNRSMSSLSRSMFM